MSAVAQERNTYWMIPGNYSPKWGARSKFVAPILKDHKWVCDIGCGMRHLDAYLPPGAMYLPSDVVDWTPETEVCDLNAKAYPEKSLQLSDCAVLLGVVERIHDLPSVFHDLSQRSEYLLVTYLVLEYSPASGRPDDWVNAYTEAEFTKLVEDAGYDIVGVSWFETKKTKNMVVHAKSKNFTLAAEKARNQARLAHNKGPSIFTKIARLFNSRNLRRA